MAGLLAGVAWVDILPNMDKFGKAMNKGVTSRQKEWAKMSAVAGGVLAAGIAKGAKDAIDAASDLNESMTKTSATFGRSAKGIQDWSKTAASGLGLAQQDALDAAGSIGAMLKPMGTSEKTAAAMSKRMVQLASDMASFNNEDPSEMLDRIRAGLSGESEPLKRFGTVLSDTRVQAFALSSGLVKASKDQEQIREAAIRAELAEERYNKAIKDHGKNSTEARTAMLSMNTAQRALGKATAGNVPKLTEQQKIMARYQLLLKDTVDQQGDFERTGGGAANQQRKLNAQIKDAQAQLGKALLPAYQQLQKLLISVTGWIGKNTGAFYGIVTVLGVLAAAMISYSIATSIATAAEALFGVTMAGALLPITLIILGLIALAAGFILLWKRSETFRKIVYGVFDGLKAIVSGVVEFIKDHWLVLLGIIAGPFGLAVGLIIKHFDKVKEIVQGIPGFFSGLPGRVKAAASGLFDGIKDAFRAAINWVIDAWNGLGFKLPAVDTHIPGVGKVGGFELSTPDIGRLAGGGVALAGRPYLVGERGPELMIPGLTGQVVPNRGMRIVITNWRQGTGYMESVADGSVAAAARTALQHRRMAR